ncbi:hypothetical protein LV780_04830 [Cereibacter azotoformans]|uniref:hypothetical protein n=1 Tax=Cereibacter azotoformans TaxID=43057 RepID=UPI000E35D4E6|nr:hypothetical protein [Cereibacter azotoformans]AXQ93194.1 hypothetical protein D0Z66_04820 [Cereibacter sphaeroides]UIJ31505.1 hypothetical protein LV780_04830 [Cereibacter azotoformans]
MDHENSEVGGEVDLFGLPRLPIRDRRGRKSFKKDKENQAFVSRRAADGWTHEMIAEDMGIDAKTLRKHFSRELSSGRIFMVGEMLDILHKRARDGHVPSVKALLDRYETAAPQAPRNRRPDAEADDEDADVPARPAGKKEQALREAQQVPDNYGEIFDRLRGRH